MEAPPKIGAAGSEYQLQHSPFPMQVWFEEQKEIHQVFTGEPKIYHKGYRMKAKMEFSTESLLNSTDYEQLRQVYNLHQELSFIPYPTTYPNYALSGFWVNEFNFVHFHKRDITYYNGSIELEGSALLSSIPIKA